MKALLERINPEKKAEERQSGLVFAHVLGGTNALNGSGDTTTGSAGGYDSWSETLPGGAKLKTASMKSTAEPYS
ncbi:TraO protein, partial [Pseudomonas amygdali pv. ulmi]